MGKFPDIFYGMWSLWSMIHKIACPTGRPCCCLFGSHFAVLVLFLMQINDSLQ